MNSSTQQDTTPTLPDDTSSSEDEAKIAQRQALAMTPEEKLGTIPASPHATVTACYLAPAKANPPVGRRSKAFPKLLRRYKRRDAPQSDPPQQPEQQSTSGQSTKCDSNVKIDSKTSK